MLRVVLHKQRNKYIEDNLNGLVVATGYSTKLLIGGGGGEGNIIHSSNVSINLHSKEKDNMWQ